MFSIPLSDQIKLFPPASLPPRHLPRIRGGGGRCPRDRQVQGNGGYLHRGLCDSGLSGVSSSCPHSPQGTCRNSHWHGCSTGHHSGKGWARSNRCPAVKWQSKKDRLKVKQRCPHRFSRREAPDPSPNHFYKETPCTQHTHRTRTPIEPHPRKSLNHWAEVQSRNGAME